MKSVNQSATLCMESGKWTEITRVCGNMSGISEIPFAFKDTSDPKVLVEEEEYY